MKIRNPFRRAVESAPIDESRYQYAYEGAEAAMNMLSLSMRHLDGVAWWNADLPPERHECWPQTKAYDGPYSISRCACGAISMRAPGERMYWTDRNRTRRDLEQVTA